MRSAAAKDSNNQRPQQRREQLPTTAAAAAAAEQQQTHRRHRDQSLGLAGNKRQTYAHGAVSRCIMHLNRVNSTARGPGVIQRAGLRRLQSSEDVLGRQISVHPCSAPSNEPSHLKTLPVLSWRAFSSLILCRSSIARLHLPPAGTEPSSFRTSL